MKQVISRFNKTEDVVQRLPCNLAAAGAPVACMLATLPVLAFCPLCPRPEVLPRPEPVPRPRRFGCRVQVFQATLQETALCAESSITHGVGCSWIVSQSVEGHKLLRAFAQGLY